MSVKGKEVECIDVPRILLEQTLHAADYDLQDILIDAHAHTSQ